MTGTKEKQEQQN